MLTNDADKRCSISTSRLAGGSNEDDDEEAEEVEEEGVEVTDEAR
jgi:hypothetical protein